MRGKGQAIPAHSLGEGITPAYAGKRYTRCFACPRPTDYPRVCGEKTAREFITYLIQGSPPRMRGKARLPDAVQLRQRITPACAGKSAHGECGQLQHQDHPRVCGEKTRPARLCA